MMHGLALELRATIKRFQLISLVWVFFWDYCNCDGEQPGKRWGSSVSLGKIWTFSLCWTKDTCEHILPTPSSNQFNKRMSDLLPPCPTKNYALEVPSRHWSMATSMNTFLWISTNPFFFQTPWKVQLFEQLHNAVFCMKTVLISFLHNAKKRSLFYIFLILLTYSTCKYTVWRSLLWLFMLRLVHFLHNRVVHLFIPYPYLYTIILTFKLQGDTHCMCLADAEEQQSA